MIKPVIFVLLLASIASAQCVGPTLAAVQTAVSGTATGGTVTVCAGTASWAAGLTISGISLIGAGSSTSGTVITAGVVTMNKNASALTRVSGFRFTNTADTHVLAQCTGGCSPTSYRAYVIDNNFFFSGGADANNFVTLNANGGLLFNNQFNMNPSEGGGPDVMEVHPGEDWSQATTFGTADTQGPVTGERNVYFEDNTFTNCSETCPDGDQGARLVIRHNTYNDSSIVFHGGGVGATGNDTSTNPPGTRQYEIYNNTFNRINNSCGSATNMSKWIWSRGGSGIIANNTLASLSSGGGCFNGQSIILGIGCQSGTYPVIYQQGQSLAFPVGSPASENPPAKPVLIFGNTGAGSPSTCSTASGNCNIAGNDSGGGGHTCSNPATFVQQGRDFFFTTSTTQPGSWSPAWTPLAYPHPLRAVLANQVASPTFSPVAGTYTSVQSVTLADATVGATICYNIGTPPITNGGGTCNTGFTYTGTPIAVSTTQTIFAIGTLAGSTDSTTVSAAYVINLPAPTNITGFSGGIRLAGGSSFTGANCGPPSYPCSNLSFDTIPLPVPLPIMGSNTTNGGQQYIPGNQQGANTVITDNISGARILRVTEGGTNNSTLDPQGHAGSLTVPSPRSCAAVGSATPSYRSFASDYSGNSTDMMWNSNSTLLTVARTGGNAFCVVPFNPATFQVSAPVFGVPFTNISWSHSSPTVLYAIGSSTTIPAGNPCTGYCIFKYDFTSSLTAPTVTKVADLTAPNACLANVASGGVTRAITWDGVFTLSSDDTTFMWPANDGYGATGGQDSGFLTLIYKIGSGCRVMNSAWASQTITSITGNPAVITLGGSSFPSQGAGWTTTNVPTQMQADSVGPVFNQNVYVGTVIRVTNCTGGTNFNSAAVPDQFVVTSVNAAANTITYTPTNPTTGTCTGGTVSMADAGYPGGQIWGDWGVTGLITLQNASNSNIGTFSNNGIGQGFRLHEAFGFYNGVWMQVSGSNCLEAATGGNTCTNDTPYFWNLSTALLEAGYLGGHFCPGYSLWPHGSGTPNSGQFNTLDPTTIDSQGTAPVDVPLIWTNNGGNNRACPAGPATCGNLAGFALANQPNYGAHCSWNNNAGTDTKFFMRQSDSTGFVGTPAINLNLGVPAVGTLPAQPFTGPYAAEILGYPTATPGSQPGSVLHRFLHSYSWPGDFNSQFHAAFFIGPISQDGRFVLFTSNWMGGLGDDTTGTNSCILGGPAPVRSTAYPASFVITPTAANASDNTYQSTGSCSTASSAPTWSATDVTDGTCTWHFVGVRSCRWDAFIGELK